MTISMHKIDIFGGKEKNMDPKIIAVDFDGTLFENKWPCNLYKKWDKKMGRRGK